MVDLLIRDANNYDRTDTRFPYLRDFDIYAGHDWASGHGAFGAGNNQESSSEGMNFANALIQWGQATGNTAVRDAGHLHLHHPGRGHRRVLVRRATTRTSRPASATATVGMVWGDGGAYATWFSADPEMIQGINMLPITGGHLYLGDDPAYVTTNYNELVSQQRRPAERLAGHHLGVPGPRRRRPALANFRANSSFATEEGESKAHTFHWIRNLAALGTRGHHGHREPSAGQGVQEGTAPHLRRVQHHRRSRMTVTFSDGTTLTVPAGRTATSGALHLERRQRHRWRVSPDRPPTTPADSPSPTPTSPSPTPTSPSRRPSTATPAAAQPLSPTRYLLLRRGAGGTAGAAGTVSVAAANGNHDGTPTNPQVFTATGLTGTYNGGATGVRPGPWTPAPAVGNGVQVRVSYDLTGDGSFDRVETYNYFATDPVAGLRALPRPRA